MSAYFCIFLYINFQEIGLVIRSPWSICFLIFSTLSKFGQNFFVIFSAHSSKNDHQKQKLNSTVRSFDFIRAHKKKSRRIQWSDQLCVTGSSQQITEKSAHELERMFQDGTAQDFSVISSFCCRLPFRFQPSICNHPTEFVSHFHAL